MRLHKWVLNWHMYTNKPLFNAVHIFFLFFCVKEYKEEPNEKNYPKWHVDPRVYWLFSIILHWILFSFFILLFFFF